VVAPDTSRIVLSFGRPHPMVSITAPKASNTFWLQRGDGLGVANLQRIDGLVFMIVPDGWSIDRSWDWMS
ncbi:MAG: hypothetical protein ACOVQM_00060, partial [Pirellula sp.]